MNALILHWLALYLYVCTYKYNGACQFAYIYLGSESQQCEIVANAVADCIDIGNKCYNKIN